jgi:peptidoglycan-associated lipoprotein
MNTTRSLSNRGTLLAALATAALATLAGCSTTKLDTPVPVESRTGSSIGSTGSGTDGANAAGASQSKVTPVDLNKDMAANGLNRVVYFDFDSFALKDEYRPTVEAYAKSLAADRKKRLAIEGHTDERGGREYNLALGQKRAEVVARSMTLLGATDTQVEAVSFGKERPAAQGSDEAAWAKNRRAELNYK